MPATVTKFDGQIGLDEEGYSSYTAEQIAINVSRQRYREALEDKTSGIKNLYAATMNYVRGISKITKLRMLESYGDISQLPKNANKISDEVLNNQLTETLIIRLDKKELERIVGRSIRMNANLLNDVNAASNAANSYFNLSTLQTVSSNLGTSGSVKKAQEQIKIIDPDFKISKFLLKDDGGYHKLFKEIDTLLKRLPLLELSDLALLIDIVFQPGIRDYELRKMIANKCCQYVALVTGKNKGKVYPYFGGDVIRGIADILENTTYAWVVAKRPLSNTELYAGRKLASLGGRLHNRNEQHILTNMAKLQATRVRYKKDTLDKQFKGDVSKYFGNVITRNVGFLKNFKRWRERKVGLTSTTEFVKLASKLLKDDASFKLFVQKSLNEINKDLKKYFTQVDTNDLEKAFMIVFDNNFLGDKQDKDGSINIEKVLAAWNSQGDISDKIKQLKQGSFDESTPVGNDVRVLDEQIPLPYDKTQSLFISPNDTLYGKLRLYLRDILFDKNAIKNIDDERLTLRACLIAYIENVFAPKAAVRRAASGKTLGERWRRRKRFTSAGHSKRNRYIDEITEAEARMNGDARTSSLFATNDDGSLKLDADGNVIMKENEGGAKGIDASIISYSKDDNEMFSAVKYAQAVFVANHLVPTIDIKENMDFAAIQVQKAVPVVIIGATGDTTTSSNTTTTVERHTKTTIVKSAALSVTKRVNAYAKNFISMVKNATGAEPSEEVVKEYKDTIRRLLKASQGNSEVGLYGDTEGSIREITTRFLGRDTSGLGDSGFELNEDEFSSFAISTWGRGDSQDVVKPIFITNKSLNSINAYINKLYNINDDMSTTLNSVYDWITLNLPILFTSLQNVGLTVNAAAAGGAGVSVASIAQAVAQEAMTLATQKYDLNPVDGYAATGGTIHATQATKFVTGDSLNYKPNPELVSVDWANKNVYVKPLHTSSTSPRFATGTETYNGSNASISRMSLAERNSALDVNIKNGLVKYTNELVGVTDDGTNTAIKVYTVNSILTDKISIGNSEVSLMDLVYNIDTVLNSINNELSIQTNLLSNMQTSNSGNSSEASTPDDNFEFPTNLDSILAGE